MGGDDGRRCVIGRRVTHNFNGSSNQDVKIHTVRKRMLTIFRTIRIDRILLFVVLLFVPYGKYIQ